MFRCSGGRAFRGSQASFLPLFISSFLLVAAGCGPKGGAGPSGGASPANPDPFRDVTHSAGIRYRLTPAARPLRILESVGSGCGFLDYDGDGHLDVLLVGTPRCALYRGDGKGSFTDVTADAGLGADGTWVGCAAADYDRDGDLDILISGFGRCALYRNDGKGHFRDSAAAAGVNLKRWCTAATFTDMDRDGWPDLYVGTYVDFGPHTKQYCVMHQSGEKSSCRPFDYDPVRGQGFRNRGDGTFENVTKRWGLHAAHGKCLGAVAGDFNNDGWPDLYVANDEMPQDLFRNEKGRGFKEVAVETGVAFSLDGNVPGGMGVDWGDFDNDGWVDLAVGTYEAEPKSLFRNLGGSGFEPASSQAGILSPTYPSVVFGTLLFDFDNDGWRDLLFANGHVMDNIHLVKPTSVYRQAAQLFRNLGDRRFEPVASAALGEPLVGRGLASGDYDDDGDLDLLIIDLDGEARLLENKSSPERNWLKVDLRGQKSNLEGLDARIKLTVGSSVQVADVTTSRSYASLCDRRTHFGLGPTAKADKLEVRWPSGKVSTLADVTANQTLVVREPGD